MTHHLSSQEFVEAVEGTLSPTRQSHVAECVACQAEVTSLAALLGELDSDVPEPSPLFWEHFQRRVGEAIESVESEEATPAGAWWRRIEWTSLTGLKTATVVMGVLGLLVAGTAYSRGWWPAESASPVATSALVDMAETTEVASAVESTSTVGAEWDFVTNVLGTLEPDEMRNVLAPSARAVDAAFGDLTAQEREAFLELLRAEMTAGLE